MSGISGGVYCKNMQSKKGSYVGLIWLSKLVTIICLCSDIYGVDIQASVQTADVPEFQRELFGETTSWVHH